MSDPALDRIEKAIEKLTHQQEEICRQLSKLADSPSAGGASQDEVLTFLDQFRAGEALGEESLGAWIAVCKTECLRGGLRTVQTREGSHARLLEERIKELGGSPSFELPEAVQQGLMQQAASTEKTDLQKLQEFMARFPDVDAALRPIAELADRLDHDPETQSLLRTIAQDERSTLEFLCGACEQLA